MFQFFVSSYQSLKNTWSGWFSGAQRAELPVLANVDAVNDLVQELRYTGDPFNGAGDFTQSAEYLYWCILEARKNQNFMWPPIDCDDFAELARGLMRKKGVPAERIILIDMTSFIKTHVVCGFPLEGKYATIDTNGLNYHNSKEMARRFFEKTYNVRYILTSGE